MTPYVKVAIVTAFPQTIKTPEGGVEAVSVQLVDGLGKLDDLAIDVVTLDRTCTRVSTSRCDGVTVHRLPWTGRNVLPYAVGQGRQQIIKYLNYLQPDVVHAHDTYGLMVRGLPVPRVLTIHGFIHGDTAVSGERLAWVRSKMWRWAETAAWADQPHIISISPYVRERLAGISTGVIHDIDNPIAESFFCIERQERKGTIFSAAVISPRKNTLTLVESFARLLASGVTAELRLAGREIDRAYALRVRQRVDELRLADQVTWLGSIPTHQVRQELATASVFALISLEENSPMGIEEAMAAGVPIVTSNRCGMPYMVRHGETGYLVAPNDPAEIARRLGELIRNDSLRLAMGQKGKQIAQDRFHPTVVARRTRDVYLQALCSRTGVDENNSGR
jgi:glycosyltransferase involved in cell wall biosynthesis